MCLLLYNKWVENIEKQKIERIKYLYYKKGFSMLSVSKDIGNSIFSTYYLMRKHNLKRRDFKEASAFSFKNKIPSFKRKASKSIKFEKIKVAGAMLYLAEGYKTIKSAGIDFANSDSEMILLFMNFLRSIYLLDEKRFRVLLYCYSNQNIPKMIKFWSKLSGIPKSQFTKPYVRSDYKIDGRVMEHGMVHIRYCDKKLLIDIMQLIGEYKKEFNAPIA